MTKKVNIHDHINEISETIEIPDDVPIEAELSRLGYSIGNIDYMVVKGEHTYEIQEYSQDTRSFEVISNVKLPEEVIEAVYYVRVESFDVGDECREHDITEEVQEELRNSGYKTKDFKDLKVIAMYTGTDYGDDCQIDVEGDFYEEDI